MWLEVLSIVMPWRKSRWDAKRPFRRKLPVLIEEFSLELTEGDVRRVRRRYLYGGVCLDISHRQRRRLRYFHQDMARVEEVMVIAKFSSPRYHVLSV